MRVTFEAEDVPWVVAELTKGVLELRQVVASARAVSCSVDAPHWAPRLVPGPLGHLVGDFLVS